MKKLLPFLMILMMSCEQAFLKPTPDTTPKAVFEQVWNFVNDKYSFFEYKNVDWDKAYKTYSTKVNDNMTEEELFKVCYDMLYELKDEHTNLETRFNISHNPEVFLDYPSNFFVDVLTRNYFNGRQQRIDFTFSLYDFNDVVYIRYTSFEDNISDYALDYIVDKLKDKKGLIIDVRNNGGGSIGNIDKLCERFIKEKTSVGVERHKSGKGKNDFKDEKISVEPSKSAKKYLDKPIVILTNRGCYSATNRFAAYMKGLPNVTLVGGVTGGGGGLPTATELSNGWVLRVSGSQFIDRRGNNIENGVQPDVKIDILKSDIDNGKDTILEKALSLIRK
jgi:Peptidase family S41/Tricorn protease C1 domain